MSRVSIYYDSVEKEQFFMVRGDERYARATKTILELGTQTIPPSGTTFSQELIVDVLHDRGNGKIVVYDNDDTVYVIEDWNSSDTARTIQLTTLNYEVEHNFKATYIGNNQCQPSSSKTITINVTDPHVVTPTFTVYVDNAYDRGETPTITGSITYAPTPSYISADMPIEVWYDGTQIDMIYTTDFNGNFVYEDFDLGESRLHTLELKYRGDGEHLTSLTYRKNISVGQQVSIISYPNPVLKGVASDFVARVTDYFGNPIPSSEVDLYVKTSDSWSLDDTTQTSSTGFATFTNTFNSFDYEGFKFGYAYEESNEFLPNYYGDLTAPTLTTPDRTFSKGNVSVITIQTNSPYANTPITFSETTTGLATTLYTNSSGYAEYNHIGVGKGNYTYKAKVGISGEGELYKQDYLQHWYPNFIRNRKYGTFNTGYLLDLDSSFQLRDEGNGAILGVDVEDNIPYRLRMIIDGTGANQNCAVLYGSTTDVTSSQMTIEAGQTPPSYASLKNSKIEINRDSEGNISLKRGSEIIYTCYDQSDRKPVIIFWGQTSNFRVNFVQLDLIDLTPL